MGEDFVINNDIDSSYGIPEEDINTVMDKLNKTLTAVRAAFNQELLSLNNKVKIFLIIAICISGTILAFYILVLWGIFKPDFTNSEHRIFEISYDIGIRTLILSFLISIVAFCLKMMRIYMTLCDRIRHKISIINSMPALVHSSGKDDLYKSSYGKIVEMLIQIGKEEPIGKENEIKLEGVVEFFKAITKKE